MWRIGIPVDFLCRRTSQPSTSLAVFWRPLDDRMPFGPGVEPPGGSLAEPQMLSSIIRRIRTHFASLPELPSMFLSHYILWAMAPGVKFMPGTFVTANPMLVMAISGMVLWKNRTGFICMGCVLQILGGFSPLRYCASSTRCVSLLLLNQ